MFECLCTMGSSQVIIIIIIFFGVLEFMYFAYNPLFHFINHPLHIVPSPLLLLGDISVLQQLSVEVN